jgi:hypothetical protein
MFRRGIEAVSAHVSVKHHGTGLGLQLGVYGMIPPFSIVNTGTLNSNVYGRLSGSVLVLEVTVLAELAITCEISSTNHLTFTKQHV